MPIEPIKPFFLSGEEDEIRLETRSFVWRGKNDSRNNVHLRFMAEYVARTCCSYELRLFSSLKVGQKKRVPFMASIGFMSRFPDTGFFHHRHRLVFALAQEEFLSEILLGADRLIREQNLSKLDLFIRINQVPDDIHSIYAVAGVGEGFPWKSKKFTLLNSRDPRLVADSARDCWHKISSVVMPRQIVTA